MKLYCKYDFGIDELSNLFWKAVAQGDEKREEEVVNETEKAEKEFETFIHGIFKEAYNGKSFLITNGSYIYTITESTKYNKCLQITSILRYKGKLIPSSHCHCKTDGKIEKIPYEGRIYTM